MNMIICFTCGRETKSALDSLVSKGGYADIAEVIEVAVDNLMVMQDHGIAHRHFTIAEDASAEGICKSDRDRRDT